MTTVDTPVRMPDPVVAERPTSSINGFIGLLGALVLLAGGGVLFATSDGAVLAALGIVVAVAGLLALAGLFSVNPGEAKVVQFFGTHTGTVRRPGLHWINPFTSKRQVSTRVRNHESDVLKVNDLDGNPIEIAAVVVWKVGDTARAVFEVDSFVEFVHTRTETAIRHIASGLSASALPEGPAGGAVRGPRHPADRERRLALPLSP